MGKDKKKKGKGAEKTALKTEKKMNSKVKKQLASRGEENIEDIVKAIEAEEQKRSEVKEFKIDPPSHRCNFSISAHTDNPEIILFGGEFYNGKTSVLNNDFIIYNTKRKEWTQIKSPGGPPPRCAHQAVFSPSSGGQLWVFGGEYTNPSETQFYHYKDLWCFHFSSKRWEKINVSGGPSARSGHRMILFKRFLVVFGGFHDNLRECKYFNDAHIFDLSSYKWSKIESLSGKAPEPRSACNLFPSSDGRSVVLFGGFCKVDKKGKKKDGDNETGKTFSDMFSLTPDKNDESFSKWRWSAIKQVGYRPSPARNGMSSAVGSSGGKVYFFGGVLDDEGGGDDEDENEGSATFFNELFSLSVENERAVWHSVEVTGKKDKVKSKPQEEETHQGSKNIQMDEEDSTVTVESGAFTITSTVGSSKQSEEDTSQEKSRPNNNPLVFSPSKRYGSGLVIRQGTLYLYGGVFEDSEGRQITLRDFYSLDLKKCEDWDIILESDITSMEWVESESSSDEDDSEDDDSDDMDTD